MSDAPGAHLTAEVLDQYIHGRLHPAVDDRCIEHLAHCEGCMKALTEATNPNPRDPEQRT